MYRHDRVAFPHGYIPAFLISASIVSAFAIQQHTDVELWEHRALVETFMEHNLLQTEEANHNLQKAVTELTTIYNSPAHFLWERCFR